MFEIKDEFYLNQQPFKILSGAIHYFRIHPNDWYQSLYNLKALGFNTVETYIPWNLHESQKGIFDFNDRLDIEAFLNLSQELGLYAIIRPSPFICAEWEWGGLPAWLINEQCTVRTSDPLFLNHVEDYYASLLPILAKHQLSQGGNILMFQVENEYGSYGEEKSYLRSIAHLMRKYGITAPLFTSDGPWRATLRAGSLIEDDILATGNFGSKPNDNFSQMKAFFKEHDKKWPLMCMEFWDGWFNRWGEDIIRRDPEELADTVMEAIALGSINLYMFHGGTNYGFMNGCSARGSHDLPQITSYDYDAILDEAGNPTQKFYLLQNKLKEAYPKLSYSEPLIKSSFAYNAVPLKQKVSLFSVIDNQESHHSFYPKNMEYYGQNTGYILYQTKIEKDKDDYEKLRIIDARDRIQVFQDGKHITTQYQDEIGNDIHITVPDSGTHLAVLVENMGRVNYGHKLTANTQTKGIGRGLMVDLHFVGNWLITPLPLVTTDFLPLKGDWKPQQPAFYYYQLNLTDLSDTYLDMTGFGKGIVFINGFNIGRFWEKGPLLSLYVSKEFLKKGINKIIIFETEGVYQEQLKFAKKHVLKNF